MVNYNYLSLSPAEFEVLARDILQVREGLLFESFKEGKDGGIDFRYKAAGSLIVIQAKRYEHYNDLKAILLSQEIPRLPHLQSSRYILVTTVDLTVSWKAELMKLFQGYIVAGQDIIGKKDLDNLLGLPTYQGVLKKHYKLWLASTEVLEQVMDQVVHRKEYNLARAELGLVKHHMKYYVQNNSFTEALDILERNRIVLISGPPGSGKTTLARALVSYYLSHEGYTELVYIAEGIEQAWAMLKEGVKQVFFFDDFLGSISFAGFSRNEERLLSKFIERVHASTDKVLFFTTREYIFRQAQFLYSELRHDYYQLSKCMVEPDKYADFVKASILYNHLYFSAINPALIVSLLEKYKYESIIYNPGYTPRLIENYLKAAAKDKTLTEQTFYDNFKRYLDNPAEFWLSVYEKQSPAARLLLIILFSLNDPAYVHHLKEAFDKAVVFYEKKFSDVVITPETFRNIIRELSDTFIRIDEFDVFGNVVRFQNPSIKDFLLEYLRNREELIAIVIESAVFYNQMVFAFSTTERDIFDGLSDDPLRGEAILLTPRLQELYLQKFIRDFDQLGLSTLEPSEYTDLKTERDGPEELFGLKLLDMAFKFSMNNSLVRDFLIQRFTQAQEAYDKEDPRFRRLLPRQSMTYFPSLLEYIDPYMDIDPDKLLRDCFDSIGYAEDLLALHEIGKRYPEAFRKLMKEKKKGFRKMVQVVLMESMSEFQEEERDADIASLLDEKVEEVCERYNLKLSKKFLEELRWDTEHLYGKSAWNAEDGHSPEEEEEERNIDELFDSLRQQYKTSPAVCSPCIFSVRSFDRNIAP